jgi:hypothetical protein
LEHLPVRDAPRVDRDAGEHLAENQVVKRQMKLERHGIRERTPDGLLNPGLVLADKFLNSHCGQR